MADTANEQKLLIPGLKPFYDCVAPYVYPMLRFAAGAILIPHGWGKVMNTGMAAIAAGGIGKLVGGGALALPTAYFVSYLELVGGALIAIGLFTRPVAAAIAIEFAVITFMVHWPRGFMGGRDVGIGYEFPLLWGVLFFAIALRGGGHLSVDRKIGKEL